MDNGKIFNVCVSDRGCRIYLDIMVLAKSEREANVKVLRGILQNIQDAKDDEMCEFYLPPKWIVCSAEEAKEEYGFIYIGYTRTHIHKKRMNKITTMAWLRGTKHIEKTGSFL